MNLQTFPMFEEGADYKLKCGFMALFYITISFHVHNQKQKPMVDKTKD